MRIQIKDSWLLTNINKEKKLLKEYKTFYNKINHINKIFYYHKTCNIPMHEETKILCLNKVNNYLEQMNKIHFVVKTGRIPLKEEKIHRIHKMLEIFPLGDCKCSTYITVYNYYSDKQIFNETFKNGR